MRIGHAADFSKKDHPPGASKLVAAYIIDCASTQLRNHALKQISK